jgi:hypothetical protein
MSEQLRDGDDVSPVPQAADGERMAEGVGTGALRLDACAFGEPLDQLTDGADSEPRGASTGRTAVVRAEERAG